MCCLLDFIAWVKNYILDFKHTKRLLLTLNCFNENECTTLYMMHYHSYRYIVKFVLTFPRPSCVPCTLMYHTAFNWLCITFVLLLESVWKLWLCWFHKSPRLRLLLVFCLRFYIELKVRLLLLCFLLTP